MTRYGRQAPTSRRLTLGVAWRLQRSQMGTARDKACSLVLAGLVLFDHFPGSVGVGKCIMVIC